MIGKTNVGGGTQFSATVNITTDPNATITMINLAGDTFSGVANASGTLTLVVNKSGTYTVVETGGGTGTVVVIDDGATYSVKVLAFNGAIIEDGVRLVNFESVLVSGGAVPTVTTETYSGKQVVWVSEASGSSAIWRTEDFIDITDYDYIYFEGVKYSSLTTYFQAYGEDGTQGTLTQFQAYLDSTTISIASMSKSIGWKFGVNLASGNAVGIANIILAKY
jgi:hypothetical protein